MKTIFSLLAAVFVFCSAPSAYGQKVLKESIKAREKERGYYLFVPDGIEASKPVPLVVLLHGSGRNGLSLIDRWKELAKKEKIILVGPNSLNGQSWNIPGDAPDAIYDLVESLRGKHPIDPRRMYVFGHSAGAVAGLYVALLESEYFAAAAVHAGAMQADDGPFVQRTKRMIPIYMVVGTNDTFFPLADVRATRDLLNKHGLNVQLNEIKNHTHSYYTRADEINDLVWSFLKGHSLAADPKFEQYRWDN